MPALEGMSFDHVLLTTRAVRKRLDLHRPVESGWSFGRRIVAHWTKSSIRTVGENCSFFIFVA